MINWNGRRYIPAGIKPVLGKRTGAPVPGRPKARWVAGWVSGLGVSELDPTACDFTFSPIFPPTPSPTPTPTPTPIPSDFLITQDNDPIITQGGDNIDWYIPLPSPTPTPTPSTTPPTTDPDADAYLADVVAAGGTTDATIDAAVDTLFVELKAAGVYSKLDILYPFVGSNSASHALNAISGNSAYDITWNGGLTHDASGTTGNGVNGYGNTNYTPSTDSSTNEIGYGIYQSLGADGEKYAFGAYNNGAEPWLNSYRHNTSTNMTCYGYSNGFNNTPITTVSSEGHFMVNFSGTSSTGKSLYYNYSDVINGSSNTGDPGSPAGRSSIPYYIFTLNLGNNPYQYGTFYIRSFYHGLTLTPTEALAVDTAINDFQTSLGRNIY